MSKKKMPEFRKGEDGFRCPTDETLKIIQEWKHTDLQSILDWMQFCRECWSGRDYFTQYGDYFCISTAGDDTTFGDLETVEAMKKNKLMWHQCWLEQIRGDCYIFRIPGENELKNKRLMNMTAYGPVIHRHIGTRSSLSVFVNWDELLGEILNHVPLEAIIEEIGPGKILYSMDAEFVQRHLRERQSVE